MILVIDDPIEFALYLNVGYLWLHKHRTPNVFHISWNTFDIDIEWEKQHGSKLYVTGHGNGKVIGGIGPNDLAARMKDLIGSVPFTKVVLLSCQSGDVRDFGGSIGASTYCQVFADKYELDTKTKIAVTGFSDNHTTRPTDGKSRSMDPMKSTTLQSIIKTTLDAEKSGNLQRKANALRPTNSKELIDAAVRVSNKLMKIVANPDDTWPKVYDTHKSKATSKVYVNKIVI